jgi:hypothetical protein
MLKKVVSSPFTLDLQTVFAKSNMFGQARYRVKSQQKLQRDGYLSDQQGISCASKWLMGKGNKESLVLTPRCRVSRAFRLPQQCIHFNKVNCWWPERNQAG